ncbi:hypothetical protein AB6A40_002891 [Gnathostoma spinigerum]|uniref:BRICHOS domain-containing protein n=1 Tax=Gnathostoma spinigerum TaxID=75299 RepID=A0ABD6EA66_9BILA
MDYGVAPGRTVEEEEIIEHYVTESVRTVPYYNSRVGTVDVDRRDTLRLNPLSPPIRNANETFVETSPVAFDSNADKRFYATGERDCSRNPSFLLSTGFASSPTQQDGTPTAGPSTTNVDTYGYDVHEVHTSEGGARIVQTHGSGVIQDDHSLLEQRDRSLSEQRTFGGRQLEKKSTVIEERRIGTPATGRERALSAGHRGYDSRIVSEQRTSLVDGSREEYETSGVSSGQGSSLQRFADTRRGTEERARSTDEQFSGEHRPGITSALKSGSKEVGFLGNVRSTASGLRSTDQRPAVYTLPTPVVGQKDVWRAETNIDESTLSRKDSYKRMQEGQQDDSADMLVSNASLMTGTNVSHSQRSQSAGLTLKERASTFVDKIYSRFRESRCTPRLLCLALLLLFLLFLLILLLVIILNAIFGSYSVHMLTLYPPVCDECRKRAPNGAYESKASTLYVHYSGPEQVQFELNGNLPFKSNSFTQVDFKTGYIAIADHALTDSLGQHTTCFLLPLDRSALPSFEALQDALSGAHKEVRSEFGWQEYWQYQAESIDRSTAISKFTQPVTDCEKAQWYFLKHTVYTKDSSCSDCYDFCLPDYSIQRLHKYEDAMTVGIRHLNCFRLYVPEWAKYQIRSDSSGGHWSYPTVSVDTRRDHEGNWVNWRPQT